MKNVDLATYSKQARCEETLEKKDIKRGNIIFLIVLKKQFTAIFFTNIRLSLKIQNILEY